MSNLLIYAEYIFAFLFGAFLFLFIFWRRLREDYTRDTVLNGGFVVFLSGFLSGVLGWAASFYLPDYLIFESVGLWFWSGFLGLFGGAYYYSLRNKLILSEVYEVSFIGILPFYFLLVLFDVLAAFSVVSFVYLVLIVLVGGLYVYLGRNYKRFSWYKSGRVGFAGLAALGVLFLFRAIIAAFDPLVISFVGSIEIVLSALVAFVAFFIIYNLSTK